MYKRQVSIRVIGTLKDEFKPPVNPGDEEITDSGEEAMEPETTTGDASSVDDETAVPTTTPDEGVIVPPVALEPTVEYTSDFPYQPEYDYAIELTYLRTETETEPEPEPEPEPDQMCIRDRLRNSFRISSASPSRLRCIMDTICR